jgi:hypothetical protein
LIKIRVSSFTIKWGDQQVVLVSKPSDEKKKKKNEPESGASKQRSPEHDFFEISKMPEFVEAP